MDVYKFDIKHKIKDNKDLEDGTILILGKFNIFHKGHLELINYAHSIKNEKQKRKETMRCYLHPKRRHASYVYKAHLLFYSNSIVLGGFEVKS